MNAEADIVGYRRPPKHTRWKKGQSGNPKGARKGPTKTRWEMIEDYMGRPLAISENGVSRMGTVLEAILLQLVKKSAGGNRNAWNALLQYERFAKQKPEIRVLLGPSVSKVEAEIAYRKLTRQNNNA